ncbi:endo-1,3(4)-beta-glucanase 2 [[Candida] jaroonii]|uniref:Endo-1,3(4)-beta-glucanase 2 n=1 Tax=[Candida] jaroonii TaxID=467808 RepID=A0ACA9YCY0_9ASCO|nr:endo-1,3(4)-beta-glucanase 2 [[Candida] jaroonii]
MSIFSGDITTVDPKSIFPARSGEVGVKSNVSVDGPIPTNNFFTNLLVENQDQPVWTNPYKFTFYGNGCNIYYPQPNQLTYGPSPVKYFLHPSGINNLTFTSSDFSQTPSFQLTNLSKFSITAKYSNSLGSLETPLVPGMGFCTAIYKGLIPKITTNVGFKKVEGKSCQNPQVYKYIITLNDDSQWSMFLTKNISLKNNGSSILFATSADVVVQIGFGTFDYYDQVAGCYATNMEISASESQYTLNYSVSGSSLTKALMFAPPHMVKNFSKESKGSQVNITVNSCTLGPLSGCIGTKLTMNQTLPPDSLTFKNQTFSDTIKQDLLDQARTDANDDIAAATNVSSMYFAGKAFAKYANLLYICRYILNDEALTTTVLTKLTNAYTTFITNHQQFPLMYDTNFKGIVSTATGDNDFGNGHYNDHHFHYGYHIYAMAIIIKVDVERNGQFRARAKDWTDLLIMDICNINPDNSEFPFMRNFDFYTGHSWAKGLYASADGKDEESSSEDINCYFAMKMYADVMGYTNLRKCCSLILGILKDSLNSYFYYDHNTIEPQQFVYNKVSGILFENKIDHTTYFGNEESYIHGIHMIPLIALSYWFKSKEFVNDEWQLIKDDLVEDNFRSILMLNYSLVDAKAGYEFFKSWKGVLDDGVTMTYCLFYCASNM